MKKTIFAIVFSLSLMTSAEMSPAQSDDKPPTPQEPYIQPVPDYGHWKVTFKYPGESAPPAAVSATGTTTAASSSSPSDGSPVSIETIKTGELRGVTLTFNEGPTKQFTCQGNWVLSSTPKGAQLSIAIPTALPYAYYTTGFIFLDKATINMSTFKEVEKHNGVMAFHYKSGDVDVWVDTVTMLPLAAKQDGVEASYQFLTPPPKPFPIPKDQEQLLQKEQAAYKTTSNMR
jgi:hypothetical protein